MIVKDESKVIERCLRSVKPWIDHWLIVDTGSTDNTPELIEKVMEGVSGEVVHRPWRNFGHNRNEALQLAKYKADYLLFIDADEQLGVDEDAAWPRDMNLAAYSFEARFSGISYDRVSLVSTKLNWQWKGVLHEYLDAGEPAAQPRLPGFWIHVTPDGARSNDPKKFEKDAALLEAALKDEPDNARYVFYLAQSYRDAGRLDRALNAYKRRVAMGGWNEEVWYSLYQVARLSELSGHPEDAVILAYLKAYEARPHRAESLVSLATFCRSKQAWNQAYLFASYAVKCPIPGDRLFVDLATYQWRAKDELALAAFYTGRFAEAATEWTSLLNNPSLPVSEHARIRANIAFLPASK